MRKKYIFPALFLLAAQNVFSQNDKVNWRLSGRMQFDAVGYISSPDTLNHRLELVDLRLGGKVNMGNWYLNVDIGFAGNKVSVKDAFLQYAQNGNYIRGGHQYVFTGIEQPNSSNDMLLNSISNMGALLDQGRKLGFTYTRAMPHYYLTAGIFMGDDIQVMSDVEQGYSTLLRAVWRPINEKERLFHIGASGYYRVPDKIEGTDVRNVSFSNRGNVRTKGPQLHQLSIDDAKNQMELSGEILGFNDRWMFQSEYYWTRVNRKAAAVAYQAHGGYVQGGYLLKGQYYGYDQVDAFPMLPTQPGSVLLVARYNQSQMNHDHSALYAGNQKDVSVGLCYTYNKQFSARLNYSYVKLDEHSTIGKEDLHLVQCRMQFRF